MKILHIISSGGMYGAEAVILTMSRVLNQGSPIALDSSDTERHQSLLAVFSNSGSPNTQLYEAAVKDGIETYAVPCRGQIDRAVSKSIRDIVAQTGADVVHAHGYKADIYVYFALRRTRTPFVSTCHTWYDNDLLVSLYGKVDRLVLRRYAGVVAVSEEVKQQLLKAGVAAEKVRLIGNGIDLRPFDRVAASLPRQESELLVGLVGRLAQEKGIDLFLQAAAIVIKSIPNARFVVAGEGPDKEKLDHLIDELGIRGQASLLGRRDDMAAVYASLDIMVSASRQEGLPMAILEGMASRRAVVATAVGEVPSLIRDRRTGMLVQANDASALATAIITLAQDRELRERLGEGARDLVEADFSAGRMTADYLRLYEDVLGVRTSGDSR